MRLMLPKGGWQQSVFGAVERLTLWLGRARQSVRHVAHMVMIMRRDYFWDDWVLDNHWC